MADGDHPPSPSRTVSDESLLATLRVNGAPRLDSRCGSATLGLHKGEAKERLEGVMAEVVALQRRLFAEKRRSLLVVLQGMDAGGKDGTIRTVMAGINPAGLHVTSFDVPTSTERAHDFLWRAHAVTPAAGRIAVWNRSHYEDVLVVRVKELVPEAVWRPRYAHIRAFEALLADEGTAVVKIFLQISRGEQQARFQKRIDSPDDRWKFAPSDLEDRARWPDFMSAYEEALAETTTPAAPWYVVPADHKWVRNLGVALILRDALQRLDPHYPPAVANVEGLVVE
eukprot:contig_31365_g7657